MFIQLLGLKIEFVVSLFASHLYVYFKISLHHEELLAKSDKANAIVEIAMICHFTWRYDLLSTFFAAQHIYEAEASGHQVFPNGVEKDCTEDSHDVNLSLSSTENFFRCDSFAACL